MKTQRIGGFQLSVQTMIVVVALLLLVGFVALYFTDGFGQLRDALSFINPRNLIPGIGG